MGAMESGAHCGNTRSGAVSAHCSSACSGVWFPPGQRGHAAVPAVRMVGSVEQQHRRIRVSSWTEVPARGVAVIAGMRAWNAEARPDHPPASSALCTVRACSQPRLACAAVPVPHQASTKHLAMEAGQHCCCQGRNRRRHPALPLDNALQPQRFAVVNARHALQGAVELAHSVRTAASGGSVTARCPLASSAASSRG